ncbi:MAG: hypothetical protein IJ550_02335 [Bacteroidaceae bacterium]|nr:hypothetical protein [Bacteroidaceae bacterium]
MATTRRAAREIRLESVVALQNELNQLKGEAPVAEDWVRRFVDYKLCEIGSFKESLIKEIEKTKLAQKVEAYFAGEGKALKEELETRKAAFREEYKAIKAAIQTLAEESFANTVWTVKHTSVASYEARIEIGLVNEDGSRIFGTEFEIKYSKWWKENAEFSTNIGTCGGQDLLDDSFGSRTFFYIQLGELLKNKELLQNIKNTMESLTEQLKAAEKVMNRIELVEADPFTYSLDETEAKENEED